MNLPKVKEFFEKKEFDLPFSSPYAKFKVWLKEQIIFFKKK